MTRLVWVLGFGIPTVCLGSCGGSTSESGAGASGTTGTTGGNGGNGGTSAGSGGKTCDSLLNAVNNALVKAKACCPQCKSIQCTFAVPGLCCPETVNTPPDSPETRAYLQAFEASQAAGCVTICTEALCAEAPSRTCQPTGTCR